MPRQPDSMLEITTSVLSSLRVARGHVPVEILIAHVSKRFRQAGHYTRIEIADRVGAAAGKAAQLRVAAGLLVYDLLHGVEVIEEGFSLE